MMEKYKDKNIVSNWNDAQGYLKMIQSNLIEFDKCITINQYEMAFTHLINSIDLFSPYLNQKEQGNKTFLTICDELLIEVLKKLFDENLKLNKNSQNDRIIIGKNREIALDKMRRVKRLLLLCMAIFRTLLPTDIKNDWITESNRFS